MKLGNKIHLYTSVAFMVLLALLHVLIYVLFDRITLDSQLRQTAEEAAADAAGIMQGGDLPLDDLLRAYVPLSGKLQLVRPPGGGPDIPPVTSPGQTALVRMEAVYTAERKTEVVRWDGQRYARATVPVIWKDGEVVSVQLTRGLEAMEANLRLLRFVLLLAAGLAMVPVFLSGRVLSRLIVQPIRALTQTMRDIQESGRLQRLELGRGSGDELAQMGRTFNQMVDLLQANFEKQERFVANASHELKTPLTVIESYAHLLKRKGLERPDLFAESIGAIHSEAVRMRELTEQLLLLARGKGQWKVEPVPVDLVQVASAVARSYGAAHRRDIHVEAEGPVQVRTDESLLRQLLFIFLDNARKYSDEPIAMHVEQTKEKAELRIVDRGIGIPKADLERVFDRFYRVDQARSRLVEGAGLGLSLAREIADAIGAQVELQSVEKVGTTVKVRLPLS